VKKHLGEVETTGGSGLKIVEGVSVLDFVGSCAVDVWRVAGEIGKKRLKLVLGVEDGVQWLAEYEFYSLLLGEEGYLDLDAAGEETVGDD